MLRMTVEGVGYDHLRQTVVVLKDWDGQKLLPIWIGTNEARAIAFELEGARPARPLSHDLLLNCLQAYGNRVTRVVINDLQDKTFYATIDIDTPQGIKHIDARPSDAIAVAVRAKCALFVDGGALSALVEVNDAALEDTLPMGEAFEADADLDPHLADDEIPSLPAPEHEQAGRDEEMNRFKRLIGDLEL